MTDEPAPSQPSQTPPSASANAPEPQRLPQRATIQPSSAKRTDLLPVLYLVGFVALAGTLFFLWQNPPESHLAAQDQTALQTVQAQLAAVQADVTKLQSQKPPAPPPAPSQSAFDALKAQVTALENKPAGAPEQLTQQVQALGQQLQSLPKPPDLQPIRDQLQALAQQVQSLPKPPDLQPLTQRIDALEKRPQFDPAPLNAKLDQLQSRLDSVDQQVKAATQRLQTATKLQGAAAALAAGQKLGDIPGAPPALARFANDAPPTEAALRESFDGYADAATRASQPGATAGQDFAQRLWTRAQQAVTVRQGDRVLVGDPIAGILAHAREQLDNGSLGGAVETLKQLAGPAAAAMQPWVDKATALVQARAALAALAAG